MNNNMLFYEIEYCFLKSYLFVVYDHEEYLCKQQL